MTAGVVILGIIPWRPDGLTRSGAGETIRLVDPHDEPEDAYQAHVARKRAREAETPQRMDWRWHPSVTFWGVIVLAVVVLAVVFASGRGSDSGGASAAASDASGAHVVLVESRSYCQEQPLIARVLVYLTLRNTGDTDGSYPDVIPYRRYSDNGENMSGVDVMRGLDVPAGETRSFYGKFGYNAVKHDLIECGIFSAGDTGDVTELAVRPPG